MGPCISKDASASGGSNSYGGGSNSEAFIKAARSNSIVINKKLIAKHQEEYKVIKYLLLGPGESGKSTIFKQMRILHGSPMTDDQLKLYGVIIRSNIKTVAKQLCQLIRLLKIEDQLENDVQQPTILGGAVVNGSEGDKKEEDIVANIKDDRSATAIAVASSNGITDDQPETDQIIEGEEEEGKEKSIELVIKKPVDDDDDVIITPSKAFHILARYLLDDEAIVTADRNEQRSMSMLAIDDDNSTNNIIDSMTNINNNNDWIGHCPTAGFGPNKDAKITLRLWKNIQALWQSKIMKTIIWKKRALVNIIDSHSVFLDNIKTICSASYKPIPQEVLLARVRTTNVQVQKYQYDKTKFELYDVGGQRAFRGKWYDCFDNVDGIIFVAALSEYDQTLRESRRSNRMVESLELFHSMCNNKVFQHIPIILFLNKIDIFEEKIQYSNIVDQKPFNDFAGRSQSVNDGLIYFIEKFKEVLILKDDFKDSYIQTCTATDTNNIEFVMNATRSIITNENLIQSGF